MEKWLSSITDNIKRIRTSIEDTAVRCGRNPEEIRLMAVTKTVPAELVNHAVAQGVNLLGENRAQELLDKYDSYTKENVDIHFIGHLQTNKVKYIVDKVSMIHSVDSFKLAKEINRQCLSRGTTMNLLLEVNVGQEDSKSGIAPEGLEELVRQISQLEAVCVQGLMTIPPICTEKSKIEGYFSKMQALTVDIKAKNIDNISMDFLSMGMSDDFVHAIPYGANIIRIGSAIFGNRQ